MLAFHVVLVFICCCIQPLLLFTPMDQRGIIEIALICLSTSQSVHLLKAVSLLEPRCYNTAMFCTWIFWAVSCICLSLFKVLPLVILLSGLGLQIVTLCFTKTFLTFSNKKSVQRFVVVLPLLYVLNIVGFVSWFLLPKVISSTFIWLNTSLSTVSIACVLSNAIGFELRKNNRRRVAPMRKPYTPNSSPRSSSPLCAQKKLPTPVVSTHVWPIQQ